MAIATQKPNSKLDANHPIFHSALKIMTKRPTRQSKQKQRKW
jgi:hypothetical protein